MRHFLNPGLNSIDELVHLHGLRFFNRSYKPLLRLTLAGFWAFFFLNPLGKAADITNDQRNYCRDGYQNQLIRAVAEDYGVVFICGVNGIPKNFYIITNSPDGENEEHIFPIQSFSNQRFSGFDREYHFQTLLTRKQLLITQGHKIIHRVRVVGWEQPPRTSRVSPRENPNTTRESL